jgi:hypothetical protein
VQNVLACCVVHVLYAWRMERAYSSTTCIFDEVEKKNLTRVHVTKFSTKINERTNVYMFPYVVLLLTPPVIKRVHFQLSWTAKFNHI